ncbi:MAG: DUF6745 domain-containing protein [Promethearchaeota archaeon]
MENHKQLISLHEKNKKYLESLDLDSRLIGSARIIDSDAENFLVELIERKADVIITYRYIRVKDSSTGKNYFLSVPNNMRTCRDAIAWTFGISSRQYDLLFET